MRVFAGSPRKCSGPEKVTRGFAIFLLADLYPATLDDCIQKEIRKRLFGKLLQREMRKANIRLPMWDLNKQN